MVIAGSLIFREGRAPDGDVICAVAPACRYFLQQLSRDPNAFQQLQPRQFEELIAGAYEEEGWHVVLTPRSGDRGRDVIAERDDFGSIRIIDQVKLYTPGRVVDADDVRSIFGVLALDLKASKALITTSSSFAPGVYKEFEPVMPSRLDVRNGEQVRAWLARVSDK